MSVIDAVLFDYGGVFTVSPFAAAGDYGREIGADPELLIDTIFGPYDEDTDHPWHRLERGEIDLGAACEAIIALGRVHAIDSNPLTFLMRMAKDGPGVHQNVVERARSLREAGTRTALVTNNAVEFREHWRRSIPIDELFDEVVDSSEEGMRKPDPRIFELTLERLGGIAAERAVFLDDYAGNVAAAERLGIRSVLVGPDPAQALADLDALMAR